MRYAILLGALLLGACAGTPGTRADVALAIACDTYATALDRLTAREAPLSPETIARVDAANKAVRPACDPDSILDPSSAVAIVETGIRFLATAKEGLQ